MRINFSKSRFMAHKVSLMFYRLDNSIPLVSELWTHFSVHEEYEVISIATEAELGQYLMAVSNGILFFKIMNKDDLQNVISVMRAHKKLIKKGLLRPVGIIGIRNKKIEQILAKNGCMDLLDPILKAKTVIYKIDMWTSPIVNQLDELERQEALKRKHRESLAAKKAAELAKRDFIFTKAMDVASDFWIFKRKADCKKVLNNYIIRILGPSPKAGHWVELAKHGNEKDPIWKYIVAEDYKNIFVVEKGTWFFNGAKPEFDWRSQRWTFSGERAHLYFYYMDGRNFSRFSYEQVQLVIAENSQFALNREEAILETCDEKYNIERESEKNEQTNTFAGDELKLSDPLTGDIKTEHLERNPLSGQASTDHLDHGPLDGKGATDQVSNNPLSGRTGLENGIDSDLDGKVATDHLHHPHLSGDREEDPLAGFDPNFNPFTLPSKNQANLDFAANPANFQTEKQKKPKKYMDLSKYMSLEGEEIRDDSSPDDISSSMKQYEKAPQNHTEQMFDKSSFNPFDLDEKLPEIKDVGFGKVKQKIEKPRHLHAMPSSLEKEEKNKLESHEKRMLDALNENDFPEKSNPEIKLDHPFMEELKNNNITIGHERAQAVESAPDYNGFIGDELPIVSLESGELKVVLKQKTNVGNDITFICKFEDFYEDELIVRAPKNSLAVNSEVFANVTLVYNGNKIKVISFGTVSEVEDFSEYAETLIIALKRVDSEKYRKFMALYQERQECITEFMSLAKGYE